MDQYDCIIAGAGPAGGHLARLLSKSGLKILLIDKAKELGEPIYSTAATPISTFEKYNLPRNLGFRTLKSFAFIGPNQKAKLSLGEPLGCVLDFRALKQFLAREAIENGADFLINTRATKPIIKNGSTVGIEYENHRGRGTAFGKIIIDATGPQGILAVKMGLRKEKPGRLLVGLEYLMENLNLPENATQVEIYLGEKYLPLSGYAWVAPTGPKEAKVGVGLITGYEKNLNIQKVMDRFLESVSYLKSGRAIEIHSGTLYAAGGIKEHVADNFMVIGDAADQCNPLIGEGIRHVLESAEIAAKTINEAVKKNDFSKKTLSAYNKRWRTYTGPLWKHAVALRDRVPKLNDTKIDYFVSILDKMDKKKAIDVLLGRLTLANIRPLLPYFAKALVKRFW